MSNPFLDRIVARAYNSHGKRSEKKVALALGARLNPNSGAMRGAKSDASKGDFRLEMKSTVHDAIKIEIGWLSKITQEALVHAQKPAVVITFVDAEGKPVMKRNSTWVLIPQEVFKELVPED